MTAPKSAPDGAKETAADGLPPLMRRTVAAAAARGRELGA